ncbi:MAG: Clp protease N-terminal domain-containing protein, partial [Bradymonadaceae bacterium]
MPQKFDLARFTAKARNALERAQTLAARLKHQHVEIEHTLLAMLEQDESTAQAVLEKVGVDAKALGRKLIDELELLPKSFRSLDQVFVGKPLLAALRDGEEEAKKLGDQFTSTEHLLISFASQPKTYASRLLAEGGATPEKLREAVREGRSGKPAGASAASEQPVSDILSKYAVDMTAMAERGELDPVIGRDAELRRLMQILTRRSKNNPVLVGSPGVGKTAMLNALSQRLVEGDVPESLKNRRIMRLDLGALVAGTSLRGQFEERVKTVIDEVVASQGKIILFIDELHQLVAGGGDNSAANLLKPALARGEISCIGTTTVEEYRQHIEADAALARRFQSIHVQEVSVEGCISILRGIKQGFEIHHGVRIDDSALVAAAQMTSRYVPDRALPDKAIDAIDEAASRLRLEIDSKPH